MMGNIKRLAGLLCFSLICSVAAAPAYPQESAPGVEARLALAAPKRVYRMGEQVRLVLSFTAGRGGYQLDTTTTKPASALDEILLSPEAGVYRWLDEYTGGQGYRPDYGSLVTLSADPARVELPLNDWFRFDRPGRHTVRVKTGRVSRAGGQDGTGRPLPPLTTNEVSFEVAEMSEEEEAREVRRLSALIDAAQGWQEEARLSEELSYLAGETSTREKVRRYVAAQGRSGNYDQNIFFGLVIARDRALALRLLEAALRDPEVAATHRLLHTLTTLRLLQEGVRVPRAFHMVEPPTEHPWQRRAAEVQQEYLRELVAGLAKRKGKSRAAAALTVLTNLPKEQSQAEWALGSVRGVLLEEFGRMHPFDQEYLLRVYWEQLRDPSLLPSVERMLAGNGEPRNYQVRAAALRRLAELSPERARPHLLAEIRDPSSVVDFEVLGALGDETLPEADDALLGQIKSLAPQRQNFDPTLLRHKAMLAARYASPAVYDGLMEVYRAWGEKWEPDTRGALLGYFARYNEAQAMPLVEEALAGLQRGQDSWLLLELTRSHYPAAVAALLRKRLEAKEPEAVSAAAYVMSQHGTEAERELIEARLRRWVQEWGGRAAELDAAGAAPETVSQRMVEVNLVESLMRAHSWKLSEAEVERLRRGCVTAACRQHLRAR